MTELIGGIDYTKQAERLKQVIGLNWFRGIIADGTKEPILKQYVFPSVVKLQNDDLLCTFTRGSAWNKNDQEIVLVRSTDGGFTWSSPTTLVSSNYADLNPCLGVTNTGRVIFFSTRYDYTTWTIQGFWLSYSDDNGHTWTTPVDITFAGYDFVGSHCGSQIVTAGDGQLYCAVHGRVTGEPADRSILISSADDGANWTVKSTIAYDAGFDLHEPAAILLPREVEGDNAMFCIMRTGLPKHPEMYQTYSSDLGSTWKTARRSYIYGNSPALNITHSGLLICATRYPYPLERQGVALFISQDFGRTWTSPIMLEEFVPHYPVQLGYPSILNLTDGRVLIAYQRLVEQDLQHTKIFCQILGHDFFSWILMNRSIVPQLVLDQASIAAGVTTTLADSEAILAIGRKLALSVECTYHAAATAGLRVHVKGGYDLDNFDTIDWDTWDVDFSAGTTVRKTMNYTPQPRFLKVLLENLDGVQAVTNVKVIAQLSEQ